MEGLLRAARLEDVRDGEGDVKGDVSGGGHKNYGENVERLRNVPVSKKEVKGTGREQGARLTRMVFHLQQSGLPREHCPEASRKESQQHLHEWP